MSALSLSIERTVDHRHPDDRLRGLEAQVSALQALVRELERKLGERPAVEAGR